MNRPSSTERKKRTSSVHLRTAVPCVLETSQLSRARTTQNQTTATPTTAARGRSERKLESARTMESAPSRAVLTTSAPYQV